MQKKYFLFGLTLICFGMHWRYIVKWLGQIRLEDCN